jgi:hypothetical protein
LNCSIRRFCFDILKLEVVIEELKDSQLIEDF